MILSKGETAVKPQKRMHARRKTVTVLPGAFRTLKMSIPAPRPVNCVVGLVDTVLMRFNR